MNRILSISLKIFFLILVTSLFSVDASAQRRRKKKQKPEPVQVVSDVVPNYTAAIGRKTVHENINKEQQLLLASDGAADTLFKVSDEASINSAASYALQNRVDWLQYEIETDSIIDQRVKAHYLTGLADILKYIRTNWKAKKIDASQTPLIIESYRNIIRADKNGQSIAPVLEPLSYDVANAILLPPIFKENAGYDDAKKLLILKVANRFPERTFAGLHAYPDVPFADSLVRVVAYRYPQHVYDYAQANNKLGKIIQSIDDDPLIKTIVLMARDPDKSGQFYFPFLDNVVKEKITLQQIDAVKKDPVKYFRLLVNTQMDYAARAAAGDTAIGHKILEKKIEQKAKDDFVAKINGLHDLPDAVRFRSIQPLTAEELYYVAVMTDGLIYTSSYTNGVYPLMMRKANNKGAELLKKLSYDHYRKFLSQAAAYNTLKHFLSSFERQDAVDLMTTFVSRLENSEGLEDGVDVADSYASIYETMPELAAQMLENVKANYDRNVNERNQRGAAIYNILYKLFLSADSANKVDLTKELGILPVYSVPFSRLKNEQGRVIAQVYFYGDRDGMGIFNGFLNSYGSGWKIDRSNKQWVTITSTKGEPVTIYANRPLPESTGEDDKAQRALGAYLKRNNLNPTVTIHRGHSYYAPTTIEYMAPSSKIVFMGSCGGFTLIDSILRKCNDAHIIASKQIGRTAINRPFFDLLSERLRAGRDIDWIPFWSEFRRRTKAPGFEDYIPPYKNLGAIFIKAYKKETGETEI